MRLRAGRDESDAFVSSVVLQVCLLVTGVLTARILGVEGRGEQGLIFVVALTCAQVGMFGLPAALTFESASRGSSPSRLLRHVRPLVLTQLVAIMAAYSFFALYLFGGRIPSGPAFVALGVLPAMVIFAYQLALLQGRQQLRELQVVRVLPSLLFAIALILGVVLGGRSLLMVISLWTASSVLVVLAVSLYLRRRWRVGLTDEVGESGDDLASLGALSRFGAAGFLGSASLVEMLRLDQIMVGVFLTTVDLGLYMVALALCSAPLFLAQGLGLVAYPKVAAVGPWAEKRRLTVRYVWLGAVVCGLVCAFLAAVAGPLIELLYGSDFSGAVSVSQVLLLATAVVCVRRILSDCLRGCDAPGAGSLAEVASIVALIPLALLLAPALGLVGFCWAMVGGYVIGLASIAVSFRRADQAA